MFVSVHLLTVTHINIINKYSTHLHITNILTLFSKKKKIFQPLNKIHKNIENIHSILFF